ncbi:4Fe-4S binding protein [Ignisphaera sp. 4213-co]|uniref:4Fe-4S binding protein n=1 Tax=Ignisphaera cupida TaxID=3050454 RepID=A0ABD4Z5L0_9CREN|nr:4Fe-4S dicluster domain-containing protein [Ignisphaera sp. 4213-co]MDK6028582.1 4Fe-4S binding protein [Ignisphaera sp. 4213-co]
MDKGFGNPILLRWIDYGKCIGCGICSSVCEFIHEGTPYIRLYDVGGGLIKPISCFHCAKAPCVEVCPTKAMRRDESGAVYVDVSRCIGCMACLYACPYGIPELDVVTKTSMKCDLCRKLRGEGLEPACSVMCPTKAIVISTPQFVFDEAKKRALAKIIGAVTSFGRPI